MDRNCKYYIKGADWDSLVESASATEAATLAFEEAHKQKGGNLKISSYITVVDLCGVEDGNCESSTTKLPTVSVMANAGLHDLALKYKKISGNDEL